MARIRVNTEDLRIKAKDFDSAAEAFNRAGDEIAAFAAAMPSYDGQLSGPARKAGYEIQSQAREMKTALAGDAESLRKTAQAFEETDNQVIDSLATEQSALSNQLISFTAKYEVNQDGFTPFSKGDGDSSAADESDIRQGGLPDCFLMSSMGAIALTHPELLENMIEVLPDGRYKVRFYDKICVTIFGPCYYKEHYVIVDGEFGEKHCNPGDSVGSTQEAWTMIIEKAYMQWQKENDLPIDLPSPAVAMSAMTGKDCVNYCMPQISMDDLYDSFRRGDAITAGGRWPSDQTLPKDKMFGEADIVGTDTDKIRMGHVYFITDVDPIANTVTVQNPWGPEWEPITMTFEDYQECFWLTTTNPVI
jgi:uncharacterized protein YukE